MGEGPQSRRVMSDEGPPPIVPNMQTDDTASETLPELVRADGGTREAPEDRPFGAPLVPDCS